MHCAAILCALSLAPLQAASPRSDLSFEIELIEKNSFGEIKNEETVMAAFRNGHLLWRYADSVYKDDPENGYRQWIEGASAHSTTSDSTFQIHGLGGQQGQSPPLLEQVIAGGEHPLWLDPTQVEGNQSTQVGNLRRVTARFNFYVVSVDYNDAYGGMIWNYSIERDGEKPVMARYPDQERYEFREPVKSGGRWYASRVDVTRPDQKSQVRVRRLNYTEAPGVAKPDWLKGKTSVVDMRFEPNRTYQVDDLKRRFKGSWPPSLEDLFEYGKEVRR